MERPVIELRAWRDEDEAAYEAIVCDPAVVEYLGEPDSDPVPQGPLLDVIGDHVCVRAAVWNGKDLVGAIWVSGAGGGPAEVTVAIRPDLHGQGLGRGAVVAAAGLIHDRFPQVAVGGRIRRDNEASLAMVSSLGAVLVDDEDPDYVVVAGHAEAA